MGYQGNYPPSTPLTSSQIGAGAVDTTALAADAVATVDIANGAVTIPKISATGTASSSTFLRGDGAWGAAGLSWQAVQTTGFTAVAGRAYPCNTTSGAFTVTLPASPSAGDQITIVDYAGTAATNNITISSNGNKIQGQTANALILTARQSYNFIYIDSTQGWISYAQQYSSAPVQYSATYLVVAGGGGGGWAYAGGGGAGGYQTSTVNLVSGNIYTVTVGSGGTGGTGGAATVGGNSSLQGSGITTVTSIGGGNGGSAASGGNGGSGGGAAGYGGTTAGTGTSGQGNNGGAGGSIAGGGGGGASAAGNAGQTTSNGNGGAGTASSITGSSVTYAGGGGGGADSTTTAGTGGAGGGGNGTNTNTTGSAGTANLGGGGGGGGRNGGTFGNGGNGGSGVVILSVPTASYSGTTTGSPTITTSGANTILKFTTSGTYTA